jgi:hypothetical protein
MRDPLDGQATSPSRSAPNPTPEGSPKWDSDFRLEHEDGMPADPPMLHTAVPNWAPGDTIPLGRDRALRVVEIRPGDDPDEDPLLVVMPA